MYWTELYCTVLICAGVFEAMDDKWVEVTFEAPKLALGPLSFAYGGRAKCGWPPHTWTTGCASGGAPRAPFSSLCANLRGLVQWSTVYGMRFVVDTAVQY